jgi:hypothetical protein
MDYPIPVAEYTGDQALTIVCESCGAEGVIAANGILNDGVYQCPSVTEYVAGAPDGRPRPMPPPAQTQLRVAHDGQPDPLPTTVPELHALVTRLEAELVDVRLQWKIEIGDLKSELQTQIGLRNAARRKLSELEGVGTPAGEVDELLDLWLDLEVRAGRRTNGRTSRRTTSRRAGTR